MRLASRFGVAAACLACLAVPLVGRAAGPTRDRAESAGPLGGSLPAGDAAALAAEVHDKGWVAFSAQTEKGDWDLFLMRPEGSDRRQITHTPEQDESLARFSPDGNRLLFQRVARTKGAKNTACGFQGGELVIAEAGGGNERSYGKGRDWASWGPDGTQVACLTIGGIKIIDVASGAVVRESPRKGVILHLTWSPDGNWFTGTANGLGPVQGIAKLNATTGEIIGISERERYNCTPDWMPDSKRVLYARGIVPGTRVGGPDGWAQLGVAGGGEKPRVLYAEEGQHVYHACSSPDGKYLLFTRTEDDAHGSPRSKMALIRYADTPLVAPDDRVSQARYPEAKRGPRLDLPRGWEPHWTYTDIAHPKERKP